MVVSFPSGAIFFRNVKTGEQLDPGYHGKVEGFFDGVHIVENAVNANRILNLFSEDSM